jgi:hypothetical protein
MLWERDGLNAIGTGNFYNDIMNYPNIYTYKGEGY